MEKTKRGIDIAATAGLCLAALMLSPAGAQSADWERKSIGGGSVKRYLFDVNKDGYVDSLSVNHWYKNPKGGGDEWQAIATGWNQEEHRDGYQVGHPNMARFVDTTRAGDINGDGWPDMVVGTPGADWPTVPPENMKDSIYVAINPKNEGSWSFYYIGTLPAKEDGVETVAIGDMNNDGMPDILAGGECKELRWYVNPGSPMQSNWTEHYTLGKNFDQSRLDGYADVEGIVIGHFDSDNYLDVAITTCSPNGLCGGTFVLTNPQSKTGKWLCTEVAGNKYSCIESIAMGDIDGNGRNDVVLSNSQPFVVSRLYWYENPDSGPWTQHTIDTLSAEHLGGRKPEVTDVDRDGDLDVICYHKDDGVTYWYENNGDGTSWKKHRIRQGDIGSRYAVGDVDKDGDLDIISGGYWYMNPVPKP